MAPRSGRAGARPAPRSIAGVAAAMQRQLHELDALLLELPNQRCCAHTSFAVKVVGQFQDVLLPCYPCGHLSALECDDHQPAWHSRVMYHGAAVRHCVLQA
jgi:hypothetical protein